MSFMNVIGKVIIAKDIVFMNVIIKVIITKDIVFNEYNCKTHVLYNMFYLTSQSYSHGCFKQLPTQSWIRDFGIMLPSKQKFSKGLYKSVKIKQQTLLVSLPPKSPFSHAFFQSTIMLCFIIQFKHLFYKCFLLSQVVLNGAIMFWNVRTSPSQTI